MKKVFSSFLALLVILAGLQSVSADDLKPEEAITKTKISYQDLIDIKGKPNRIDLDKNNKWLTYLTADYKNYELYYFKDNLLKDIYISKLELLPQHKITNQMTRDEVDAILVDFKPNKFTNKYIIEDQVYNFYYDIYGLNNILGVEITQKDDSFSRLDPSKNLAGIYEKQLLDLTNVFRAQNGKKILLPLQKLDTMAKFHAVDMRKNNYINVIDSQGRAADTRLADYDLRFKNLGENVTNTGYNAVDLNKYFLQSEYHRENILSDEYENIGTGICTVGEELYCTQVFFESLK